MSPNGEPEVETDFEEIKREVADQEELDRESSTGPTEVAPETPIADVDYLPGEPGPASSVEDYDPLDVDPEDVDDK